MKKQELEKVSSDIVIRAKKLKVVDQKTLDVANLFLNHAKETLKQAVGFFAPAISKAHEAHKEMIKAQKVITDPLSLAVSTVNGMIRSYVMEAERKAREAEEKRKFEEEVYFAQLEEKRKTGDKKGEKKALAKVEELHEESLKLKVKPELVGSHVTRRWKFRVIDLSVVPRQYLVLDETRIQRMVTQMKAETSIPGIEAYEDVGITQSRT